MRTDTLGSLLGGDAGLIRAGQPNITIVEAADELGIIDEPEVHVARYLMGGVVRNFSGRQEVVLVDGRNSH